jgi:hypothetical protein
MRRVVGRVSRWAALTLLAVIGCAVPVEDDLGEPPEDSVGPEAAIAPLRSIRRGDLPTIYAQIDVPDAKIVALVRDALDGLGMDAKRGPRREDRVYVGRWYVAWVDQTGFVGKINGLWQLNGRRGDALGFVLRRGKRPINVFVPGERGDGAWPAGYAGAEHFEMPNPNRPGGGSCGDFCGQYGHLEANPIGSKANQNWRSCNGLRGDWDRLHRPTVERAEADSVTWIFQAPMVRIADFEGSADGNDCGADWVFADGKRRRVHLLAGYRLYADRPFVDRIYTVVNPAGNPPFTTNYSGIGGFVMTSWPNPLPEKSIHEFWRLAPDADRDRRICWRQPCDGGDEILLRPGAWTAVGRGRSAPSRDVVFGYARAAFSMSPAARDVRGRTFTVDVVGEHDDLDVGGCLCTVHGGIEMGGGMIHGAGAEPSLPLRGGARVSATRRLSLTP